MQDAKEGLTLVELAMRKRWGAMRTRAARHPEELLDTNQDGVTALHIMVVNQCPVEALSALLHSDTVDPVQVRKACMSTGQVNLTPLFLACCTFPPIEIMRTLVDACPDALSIPDAHGSTCLHGLCLHSRHDYSRTRRGLARAEILLEVDPSLAKAQNKDGEIPIHFLCVAFREQMTYSWLRYDEDGLWLFFDKLLCLAGYADSGSPLHQIVRMPSPPEYLVRFACSRSECTDAPSQDSAGNTPLHLAVDRQLQEISELLIGEYPDWATVTNHKGEAPLHVATKSFRSYSPVVSSLIRTCPRILLDIVQDDALFPILFSNILGGAGSAEGRFAVFDILRRRPRLVGKIKY